MSHDFLESVEPVDDDAKTDQVRLPHEESYGVGAPKITLVIHSPQGERSIALTADRSVTLGRSEPAELIIDDPMLSRRHATFSVVEQRVWVEDLESTNGTHVNSRAIKRAAISSEDEIRLGGCIAYVHVARSRGDARRGLLSHDRFSALLEDEVVRARMFGRTVSVIFVRSEEASESLRPIVDDLQRALRPVDRVGVYAPFALELVLPEIAMENALSLAEKIRELCASAKSKWRFGVATFGANTSSGEALLAQAIKAAHGERGEGEPARKADDVLVADARMRALYATVDRIASSQIPVLIAGETGVGKELVARALHEKGPRAGSAMRSINCGAIPQTLIESVLFGYERGAFTGADKRTPGLFESANGGTVFLDEVGELTLQAQAALLRVIDTGKLTRLGSQQELDVDVRIVAATNRDLESMCAEGRFRWDLLYRLSGVPLEIPPLRERRTEIRPLADLFRKQANRSNKRNVLNFDDDAIAALERYQWPGNVREMKNEIERAVVVCSSERIALADLSERIRRLDAAEPVLAPAIVEAADTLDFRARVRRYEIELIMHAMEKCGGNQTEAARFLKIPLRTLTHKLSAYDLRGRRKDTRVGPPPVEEEED